MFQSAIGKLEIISRDFPTVLNIVTCSSQRKPRANGFSLKKVAVEESLLSKATKRIRKRKLHFGEKDDTDNRKMGACSRGLSSECFQCRNLDQIVTRKYMHAETLALLTKPFYFPNMKYLK